MSLVYCVSQFVDNNVVLNPNRGENQSPVEPNRFVLVLSPPTIDLRDPDTVQVDTKLRFVLLNPLRSLVVYFKSVLLVARFLIAALVENARGSGRI